MRPDRLIAISTVCLLVGMLAACAGEPEASRSDEDGVPVRTLTAAEYYEKVHGAWLGASVAGALGMSVEGMHMRDLKPYLTGLGQWPLTEYIKTLPPHKDPQRKQWYTADDWGPTGFGPDDDTLYQVANLLLVEEKGAEITSQDIADKWLASFSVFEAQNCGRAVRVAERLLKQGVKPPESGQHEMGEFMGGQMKGEFENDPVKLLEAGLAVIPEDCDYARCIRDVMQWHRQWPDDWEKAHEQIDAKWAPEGDKQRRVFPNNAVNA